MTESAAATLTRLYHNAGGQLTDSGISLLNVDGIARWGDFDNDGDLDLLVGGWSASPAKGHFVQLYRNDLGAFVPAEAGLPSSVAGADAAWGDFDNDGDLDLALVGWMPDNASRTFIYRNDRGRFAPVSDMPANPGKSVAWGDLDGDGDLDLLVAGDYLSTHVYRNEGGRFVDVDAGLIAVDYGAAAWVDYDGDGDLDVVVSGLPAGAPLTTRLYRNDGGVFVEAETPLAAAFGPPSWGDYDADGDLDALVSAPEGPRLYRNDDGRFTEVPSGLPAAWNARCSFGDYDNDGRQDVFVSGFASDRLAAVYRNTSDRRNSPPEVPANGVATVLGDGVRLDWDPASDTDTRAAGLSYNVRVGTTPGGGEVVPPMADAGSGFRFIVAAGNAGERSDLNVANLPPGRYYWAVQALDASFAGSPFTETASFVVEPPPLLSVTLAGSGAGAVASAPAGIDCGVACDARFPRDTVVTLTATAAQARRSPAGAGPVAAPVRASLL